MERLQIPLQKNNQPSYKYLRYMLFGLSIVILAWIGFRTFQIVDRTTAIRPPGTASSLFLLASPSSGSAITNGLANKPIFSQKPWTFHHLFTWCQRSCSVHLSENGEIQSISIQNNLNETTVAKLEMTGIYVVSDNGSSLISTKPVQEIEKQSVSKPLSRLKLLLPWNDGLFFSHDTKRAQTVRVRASGITIIGGSGISAPHQHTFESSTDIIAGLSYFNESLPPLLTATIQPSIITSALTSLQNIPLSFVLGTIDQRLVFSIQTPVQLSQQEAALLSKELVKMQSLSTQSWTLSDGTVIDEQRFSDEHIRVDTTSEGQNYFLRVFSDDELLLRMTQSGETFTLSNQEISLEQGKNLRASCHARARAFIRVSDLIPLLHNKVHIASMQTARLPFLFEEIAFLPRKTIFCWGE